MWEHPHSPSLHRPPSLCQKQFCNCLFCIRQRIVARNAVSLIENSAFLLSLSHECGHIILFGINSQKFRTVRKDNTQGYHVLLSALDSLLALNFQPILVLHIEEHLPFIRSNFNYTTIFYKMQYFFIAFYEYSLSNNKQR